MTVRVRTQLRLSRAREFQAEEIQNGTAAIHPSYRIRWLAWLPVSLIHLRRFRFPRVWFWRSSNPDARNHDPIAGRIPYCGGDSARSRSSRDAGTAGFFL
jgi:hypothetical protein